MTIFRPLFTLAATAALVLPAHATDVALVADGAWNEFAVDDQSAPLFGTGWIDNTDGSAQRFSFTISPGFVGRLNVVDAGFAGDVFAVANGAIALGTTSVVPLGSTSSTPEFDFDTAFASGSFSRGVFTLGEGAYSVSGSLIQSVRDVTGAPLNATFGAVSLTIASVPVLPAVPEPATYVLLLTGLGVAGLISRRRA